MRADVADAPDEIGAAEVDQFDLRATKQVWRANYAGMSQRRMFSGLRSQCTTLCAWMNCNASRTCCRMRRTRGSVKYFRGNDRAKQLNS